MPFSKIVGLDVTPLMPSCSTRRAMVPSSSRSRFRLSIQIAWPSASISRSKLLMMILSLYSGCGPRAHELAGGRGDGAGVDACLAQQLFGCPGAGHDLYSELTHGAGFSGLSQRAQHGLAEPALGPVVLGRDDRPRLGGGAGERLRVHGLHGVEVDHARFDAVAGEILGGAERLVERHAGADERDVVAVAHHAAVPDFEPVVGSVDHREGAAMRAQVGDPVEVGHK